MASKTITGSTNNENISARLVCSSTPYTEGNYSLVNIVGQLSRTNTGYTTYGDGTFYIDITIDGKTTTYSASGYKEITYNSNTEVVAARNIKVAHASDGTRTITVALRGSMPGTSLSSISCSGTFTLDPIPRASTITANSSVNAGDSLAITITRAVSTFTHTVTLTFGSKTLTNTGVATSTSFAIPLDWLEEIPNAASGVATIGVTTYSGSTKIGISSKPVTINAPSSAGPKISSATLTAVNQFQLMYLKTLSQVKITLTATALYGATIKSYKIVGGGFSGMTNPYTTPVLQQAGTYNFACTVTDSRGLSTTVNTDPITVQDYSVPSYTSVSAQRCDSAGTLNINGTYIKALANVAYASLGGKNTISITVKYRKVGTTLYSAATALSNNTAEVIGAGSILINEMWDVHFEVTDTVGNVTPFDLVIVRADYLMTISPEHMGLLTYAGPSDANGVMVGGDMYMTGGNLHLNGDHAIAIEDLRDCTPTPNLFGNQAMAVYFDQEVDDDWRSILHLKGGDGSYVAWQLAGPAGTGNASSPLAWRAGVGGGDFDAWRKIFDDSQIIPIVNGGTGASKWEDARENLRIYAATIVITRNNTQYQDIAVSTFTGGKISSASSFIAYAVNGDIAANGNVVLSVYKKDASTVRVYFSSSNRYAMRLNCVLINH